MCACGCRAWEARVCRAICVHACFQPHSADTQARCRFQTLVAHFERNCDASASAERTELQNLAENGCDHIETLVMFQAECESTRSTRQQTRYYTWAERYQYYMTASWGVRRDCSVARSMVAHCTMRLI